ncbi:MAG TPA: cyclic nucleotide-binding domain-containing protein [Thermoplasmata archaeon]|nr:cyclic nucleotide-binding domain-containing protein [Thermoplasmata archaeon]
MSGPAPPSPTALLAAHDFFRGLPATFLAAAGGAASERAFRAGEFLLREGRPADQCFAILDGKVALEVFSADRRLTVQTVGRGELLGWSWLVSPHRWTLDAIAVKPTRALAIDVAALWSRFTAAPTEGYEFLLRLVPVLAGRIQAMEMQLFEAHDGV